jgi:hypothetical protein
MLSDVVTMSEGEQNMHLLNSAKPRQPRGLMRKARSRAANVGPSTIGDIRKFAVTPLLIQLFMRPRPEETSYTLAKKLQVTSHGDQSETRRRRPESASFCCSLYCIVVEKYRLLNRRLTCGGQPTVCQYQTHSPTTIAWCPRRTSLR